MSRLFSWQVPQLEQLRNHLFKQDLAHAYLIDDPAGEGSQGFVQALASTILCEQTELGGCSGCPSCQLQNAGSHSDLLWVTPEDSKQIKIEQIRSVIEWSHQTPQQGRAKVLVLDPADRMNVYATNSLLKLLEEPAPNTYLFLISTSPARLLPTIRSRCQRLNLSTPTDEEGLRWLIETSPDADPELLEDVYAITGRRPISAQALIDSEQVAQRLAMVAALTEWVKGYCGPLETTKKLAAKEAPSLPYELLYRATAIAQRQQFLPQSANRGVFQALIDELAGNWSTKALSRLADECGKARSLSSASNNLNGELLLEHFLMTQKDTA
jgi:DNA polymerase-3 subunit delta'